ncbi:hypothetical protein OJF2_20090 [Aquisphaera giovannonii]|uniref:Heparinase II/III-like protein n=1 Tax=Aquisphaera giovannonii TaxID=406548 RepID=A0A5B9VZV3_9BACT|nr:hypothetical protein [Aquisphaera giovannonii]QEH33507.1 hypothetical protein OJF2_20090 [Aquisphaera giovannonii]
MRGEGSRRCGFTPRLRRLGILALAVAAGGGSLCDGRVARAGEAGRGDAAVLAGFELPAQWRATFWKGAGAQALLKLSPRELADLVPVQAGLRFCRCPACGAAERDEPLAWSIEQPKVVKCRFCRAVLPNEKYPSKGDKKEPPEEVVEVVPGVAHHYPYHPVEDALARYADERIYIDARRDYEARKFLARSALYAAVEYRSQPAARRDARLATTACVVMLRFAQVYPHYATHVDQPDRAKILQPARLRPPLASNYEMARWEWNGSLEVPANLLVARCLLRGDPAWARAGELLGEKAPEESVDRNLFLAAAETSRQQPDQVSVQALNVYRGMLAVGRVTGDESLVADAMARLDGFARRGFYHDGFWRDGELAAHARILSELDGWLPGLLGQGPGEGPVRLAGNTRAAPVAAPPIFELARKVRGMLGPPAKVDAVEKASWPSRPAPRSNRRPVLLGGVGRARLAIGGGDDAMDAELLGMDSYGGPHFQRLALRLSIAGRPVLGDLDDSEADVRGWRLATASHNAVIVDRLNQREQPKAAVQPAGGSRFLFFAADPDFQVACAEDQQAYPLSTTRYRHTLIASAGATSRYVVSVFEVLGGTEHDQIYHSASGQPARWALPEPLARPPASLLPSSITFLPSARPEDGRWFVQAYGEFRPVAQASLARPAIAELVPTGNADEGGPALGLRLHVLGDLPLTAIAASSPEPPRRGSPPDSAAAPARASLILRRRAEEGGRLGSVFVTLFEPTAGAVPRLVRVGRVASDPELVILFIETSDGPEHLIVNLSPGNIRKTILTGGRHVSFDGLALRIRGDSVVLAGGTFAEASGRLVSQPSLRGTVAGSVSKPSSKGLGWFVTPTRMAADPALAGRALIIEHGDGSSHSWTLSSVEPTAKGTRLHVLEEPGFSLESDGAPARFHQFPQVDAPGPHRFRIALMTR